MSIKKFKRFFKIILYIVENEQIITNHYNKLFSTTFLFAIGI